MRLNQLVGSIAEAGRSLLNRNRLGSRSVEELCVELCSSKGEAMGTAIAQEVVDAYQKMDHAQKLDFFRLLLSNYNSDRESILSCAQAYTEKDDVASFQALCIAVEGTRKDLFRSFNMAPDGTSTLVKMREDLTRLIAGHSELKAIDIDLLYLLKSWFNRGFLTLETIDWHTPAHILEKLIAYEAVHEMQGWEDLRRRLADDRRCFAFFHPGLPDEPLIFLQVALVKGLSGNVQELLAEADVQDNDKGFDTAIFYSISNCQEGLKGISFGNFLIKQVVMELRKELPQLKRYATLSPIPGFRRWLSKELAKEDSALLQAEDRKILAYLETDDWHTEPGCTEPLKPLLMSLCAHYLYYAKRGEQPQDPVERFHLGNGARIERLNWLADVSGNGITQSAGMLVNYGYELGQVEENHETYVNDNTVVVAKDFQRILSI
ncbi:MAG: malonyl-CoA decarboxylase [Halieaceae bacterium]|jgi:malonyl-CoA decarboxylase|nr:malonyl-CoA decarboxylase [Halieaceae bacterium]